jgi:hypothetical protein
MVACVNFQTDPLHCGDCGTRCQGSQLCIGGTCRRYSPATPCNTCPCNDVCGATTNTFACCAGAGSGPPVCIQGTTTCP